jgi:hypothetical protein
MRPLPASCANTTLPVMPHRRSVRFATGIVAHHAVPGRATSSARRAACAQAMSGTGYLLFL